MINFIMMMMAMRAIMMIMMMMMGMMMLSEVEWMHDDAIFVRRGRQQGRWRGGACHGERNENNMQ